MKILRWAVLAVFIFGVAAGALILRSQLFEQSYAGFQKPVNLEIPRGTSTWKIGEKLAESGVIRYPWQFAAMRALRLGKSPQAGDYQFKQAATAAEVFDRIARGDVFVFVLRVPEGSNIWEVATLVEEAGILPAVDFLVTARRPALIRDLAPQATSLEGYLFPATYEFRRQTTADEIAKAMVGQFRKVWREIGGKGNANQIVTLASLVETEARLPGERPQIAGVYANRLRIGMKLDCDPTVIYAALLEDRFSGTIYKSDLENENPYNTYKHPGLPPGPIANPGVASLTAALNPAPTQNLFFVAKTDGSGGHIFSRTLKEHNVAVSEYRRGTASTVETPSGKTSPPGKAIPSSRRNGTR